MRKINLIISFIKVLIIWTNSDFEKIPVFSNNDFKAGLRINLGSPTQKLNLILSSVNSQFWLSGSNCTSCEFSQNKYNDLQSKTSSLVCQEIRTINYPHSEISGHLLKDLLTIGGVEPAEIQFLYVDSQSQMGWFRYDGLISIGFFSAFSAYIADLHKAGKIPEQSLEISLTLNSRKSYMSIGKQINYTNTTYIEIHKTSNSTNQPSSATLSDTSPPTWYFEMTKLNMSTEFDYTANPQRLVLDIQDVALKIPRREFLRLKDIIFPKSSACQITRDSYIHCHCDAMYLSTYPTIELRLNQNFKLSYTPEDYLILDTSLLGSNCIVLIGINYDDEFWRLGSAFAGKHIITFDYSNERIGFRSKANEDIDARDLLVLIASMLIASILFFLMVYMVYKRCTQRRL